MPFKHYTSMKDLTLDELADVMALAAEVKSHPEKFATALTQKGLAMIFQKPSTRTRVSFEVGINQMGGYSVVLGQNEVQLGRGESLADTAQVLSRYLDVIMARVFGHQQIEELAEFSSVPVINGLSDLLHPCQSLTDYFTMQEKFDNLKGLNVVYLGDGNNVAHSLAYGAAMLGVTLDICTPELDHYLPNNKILEKVNKIAKDTGAQITLSHDPRAAVKGSQVVYTDVWTSMGQEKENQQRKKDFAEFQINSSLFELADNDAIFMHCLPAHRGEEVTDAVADHERSVIFDQAENRLHAQKALLLRLLGK